MKTKRFSYTTTLKNPLTWLAALLALAAAVGFLGRAFAPGTSCWTRWIRDLLPGLAALYFVYQLLTAIVI